MSADPTPLPCSDPAAREAYARRDETADLRRAFDAIIACSGGGDKVEGEEKGEPAITPAHLSALFARLGHRVPDPADVADVVWEVDDDADGAVSWGELRAAADRAWADGGGGGRGGASPSAAPGPSPLLAAAAGRAPRRLVDIARFLARADPGTGRLALAAAAEDEHLRTGRSGLAELMEVREAARGERGDGEGWTGMERETGTTRRARAAPRSSSLNLPLPLSSPFSLPQDLGPAAVASGSLSLTEFLAAQAAMQTRCLRAGPAAVSGVGGGGPGRGRGLGKGRGGGRPPLPRPGVKA